MTVYVCLHNMHLLYTFIIEHVMYKIYILLNTDVFINIVHFSKFKVQTVHAASQLMSTLMSTS